MKVLDRLKGTSAVPRTRVSALVCGALLALALVGIPHAAHGDNEDARQILDRMRAAYEKAKTYSGKLSGVRGGKAFTRAVKYVANPKGPALYRLMETGLYGRIFVQDDKTAVNHWLSEKSYSKSRPDKVNLVSMLELDPVPHEAEMIVKVLPDAQVDGKTAYVVEISPPGNPDPVTARNNTLTLFIDKQTYMVLRTQWASGVTTYYSDQKFDAPIPASEFKFTPPAGVYDSSAPPKVAPDRPAGPPSIPANPVPLSKLIKRGKVTFSAWANGQKVNNKIVLSPDGTFVHFQGDIGERGTYELDGDRLVLTKGALVTVWTLQKNGTVLLPPVGLNGVYKTYWRD
ncbi:MAG TPA: hypothetical protein VKU00_22830 [Chthonomonadaceae bacterium]|nr:hypothetical protein [Chthonomonadaceae bacterium]